MYDFKWVASYVAIDWKNFNPKKNLVKIYTFKNRSIIYKMCLKFIAIKMIFTRL